MGPYQVMALAWVLCAAWIAFVIFTNKKAHPKALFYLFFVEMWERFSYYGMRALLVLYMTSEIINGSEKSGLGYDDGSAYGVYGAYGALVYLTPILGGLIADKLTGYRKAIMWGAILMALGHLAMAIPSLFFPALALLILGNGFFKPNISSLIGKLYPEGDPRRDGGFTIFYMGINIGAFLTGLTCGTIGELEGWHYGFSLAGVGMVVGLIVFWFAQRNGVLGEHGYPPEEAKGKKIAGLPVNMAVYIGSFLILPLIIFMVKKNDIVDIFLGVVGTGVLGYLLWLASSYDKVAKQRIWVIMALLFFTTLFWSFFELAGSALTVFTKNNVIREIAGVELTAANYQSFNPLFIMLFAPIFAWLWVKLSKANFEPPAPVKFAAGLMLLGVGFLVLQLGKGAAVAGAIPGIFMVGLYLFHTLGELTLSPVGLSMVTKLSPAKIVGFVMGTWFLSSSIAHQAGKHIAKMTTIEGNPSPEESLDLCLAVFNQLGFIAIGAGVLLLLISPILNKWMHGIK